jgi:hypothetical protein
MSTVFPLAASTTSVATSAVSAANPTETACSKLSVSVEPPILPDIEIVLWRTVNVLFAHIADTRWQLASSGTL